jgi:hypothetical protein
MSQEIEQLLRCKKIIEQKLDWGDPETWQASDFENLHQRILDETGVSLSDSTLRRIWGRVKYDHLPSSTTLNTLAQFAGFENWRVFIRSQQPVQVPVSGAIPVKQEVSAPGNRWIKIALAAVVLIAVGLAGIYAFNYIHQTINTGDYSFNCKPLTRQIPNSVVFTYDASASPTDSVYIQQSWDPRKRTRVDKTMHTHTSVYYEPGFFQAKLLVGDKIVKEHRLIIPTNGWLGAIDVQPVPVYLNKQEFLYKDGLSLSIKQIETKNIPIQPRPPFIRFFNVGNFDPVPVTDFSFNAVIKNEYNEGASACQFSYISLITNDIPILIPVCATGCVGELMVYGVDHSISGKDANLSGFGVDFSQWVTIACKSIDNKIQYVVNGKVALEFPLPVKKDVQIVGLTFGFQGAGSVKTINLDSKGKSVFHAF